MTKGAKTLTWIIGVILVCLIGVSLFFVLRQPPSPQLVSLTGVVLAEDADPQKQVAVAHANILAVAGGKDFQTQSDASGLFRLSLPVLPKEASTVSFTFQAEQYQPLQLSSNIVADRLLVIRMLPESRAPQEAGPRALSTINRESVRVRYTTKMTSSTGIGALVKTFEAVNKGGVACTNNPECSPDGKWKAKVSSVSFDAGTGNQFLNARVSCIAGPCPFTRVETANLSDPGQSFRVSVRNWSDTATFLVEAEVSRVVHGDLVRESTPAIFGPALSFTLPPGGEGPSIGAEVNGTSIVFPLGPEHLLSWATCNVQAEGNGTQVFHCELKRGYQFR